MKIIGNNIVKLTVEIVKKSESDTLLDTDRLRAYDGVFVYVYVADVREMNRTAFEMESEMESGLVIIGGNHFGMI